MPMQSTEVPFVIPRLDITRGINLGQVDPRLYLNFDQDEFYEVTEDHIGRIWFTVKFVQHRVDICIIKARNLYNKGRKFSNTQCSPFLVVELTPYGRAKSAQTKAKKNTNNPDFNENFSFEVDAEIAKKCTIHIAAIDVCSDRRQKILGHAFFSMREMSNVAPGRALPVWRNLCPGEKRVGQPGGATIVVGLLNVTLTYYEMLERLVITINELDHLRNAENGADIFVKIVSCYQGDNKSECKRSSNYSHSENKPVKMKESFQFKASRQQLCVAKIFLTVHCRASKSESEERTIAKLTMCQGDMTDEGELLRYVGKSPDGKAKTAWLALLPSD